MRQNLTPDACFVISIALSIFFNAIFPVIKLIPYPYSLSGILLIAIGILLVYTTNLMLLKKKTSTKPFGSPVVLITTGPFQWSRNPIYLGMTIALFGVATVLGSLSALIFPILFAFLMDLLIIPVEEQHLEKQFGNKYLAYKATVRRWF